MASLAAFLIRRGAVYQVVACLCMVGSIDNVAQALYRPDVDSPGDLHGNATFGWLLGYILLPGGHVPEGDPLGFVTSWKAVPEAVDQENR